MVDANSFLLHDLGVSDFKFFCWPMALQSIQPFPTFSHQTTFGWFWGPSILRNTRQNWDLLDRRSLPSSISARDHLCLTLRLGQQTFTHPLSACCRVFGNASSQLKFITTYKHPKDEQKHWTALGPFPAARVESHGVCCFRSSHDLRRCCRCQLGCHIHCGNWGVSSLA